jgi:hypothetical protein
MLKGWRFFVGGLDGEREIEGRLLACVLETRQGAQGATAVGKRRACVGGASVQTGAGGDC